MKVYFVLIALLVSSITDAQVSYKNPVLPGFYSDPSICRVGDDYYMVHSSFGYFPGVPIFHSKNLVNWEQISYALTSKNQVNLEKAGITMGIFAATIRYHEGLFYMITTNVLEKQGAFYVTAKDPKGPWSDPIWTEAQGIDPCFFFDEDGKTYITSTVNWGPNIKEGIYLLEIDPKTGKSLNKPKLLWEGTGGRYPEGPHLFRKDGYYYLMIAEGGTEFGHKETIARSKYLEGPYNGNPANPIATHINMNAETSPIQGLGHADLVETQDGNWFMVAHAFRNHQDHQILGRETFLLPVRWDKKAWPVVNNEGTAALDMQVASLPAPLKPQSDFSTKTSFDEDKLGYEWNYINNPIEANYSLSARKGYLRLMGSEFTLNQLAGATFIGRRQQHYDFQATVSLDFMPQKINEEAGITAFKSSNYHYDLSVKNVKNKRLLVLSYYLGKIQHIEKEIPLETGVVQLRISGSKDYYSFEYTQGNKPFMKIAEADTRFLSSVTTGGFTGTYLGLFATGNGQKSASSADFDSFTYAPK